MFYVYTIVIPILILLVNYFVTKNKPKKVVEYIGLLLRTIPIVFGYAFFLYFLEREKHINTSWAFYTVIFFLIPITIIALVMKLYYWIRLDKKT